MGLIPLLEHPLLEKLGLRRECGAQNNPTSACLSLKFSEVGQKCWGQG